MRIILHYVKVLDRKIGEDMQLLKSLLQQKEKMKKLG